MQIADLLLADYAFVIDKGKFTLVGAGFTEILTVNTPYVHPLLCVFIRLKVAKEDIGQHILSIQLIGEKGPICKAQVNINIANNLNKQKCITISSHIGNIKFPFIVDYDLEVRINGELKETQQLTLKSIKT